MLFPSRGESEIVQNVQCFFGHFLLFPPLMKPSHLSFQISSIAGAQCSMDVQARSSAPDEGNWWVVSRHLLKERKSPLSQYGTGEARMWDFATVLLQAPLRPPRALENCPLFPVLCFLNHLLCKTIAEFDSQKCSEALGVKYYDKRRHSSSLLHRTF